MIFFSRGKIAIQSHYLAVDMSSAAANVVCVSLIFIQQTAMRQNLKLSFVFDLFLNLIYEETIISDSSIAKILRLLIISWRFFCVSINLS